MGWRSCNVERLKPNCLLRCVSALVDRGHDGGLIRREARWQFGCRGHSGGDEGGLKWIVKVDQAECLCWILVGCSINETGSR